MFVAFVPGICMELVSDVELSLLFLQDPLMNFSETGIENHSGVLEQHMKQVEEL